MNVVTNCFSEIAGVIGAADVVEIVGSGRELIEGGGSLGGGLSILKKKMPNIMRNRRKPAAVTRSLNFFELFLTVSV